MSCLLYQVDAFTDIPFAGNPAAVCVPTPTRAPDAAIHFDTKSGRLTATRRGDWTALDLPSDRPEEVDPPPAFYEGLGHGDIEYVGRTDRNYFVQVPSAAAVRACSPDLDAMAGRDARGVIVTALADESEVDVVSRFFARGRAFRKTRSQDRRTAGRGRTGPTDWGAPP